MTAYDDQLAAEAKKPALVWDFPELTTRFVAGRVHSGLSLPSGWTQFVGCLAEKDTGAKIDYVKSHLSIGSASLVVPDVEGAVTAWLKEHEFELCGTPVHRKEGFRDLDEGFWQTTYWIFDDFKVAGKSGGGYDFELASILRHLSKGLFDDFDGEDYRLDETVHNPDLLYTETTITLEKSPKGSWREPGYALLWYDDAKACELVAYASIGGTGNKDLQSCTRHALGVGDPLRPFPSQSTSLKHVWVRRGDPISTALELITTTDRGPDAVEALPNGDFEDWTADDPDDFTVDETYGDIGEENVLLHSGSACAKVVRTASGYLTITKTGLTYDKDDWLGFGLYLYAEATTGANAVRFRIRNTTRNLELNQYGTWQTPPTTLGFWTVSAQYAEGTIPVELTGTTVGPLLTWFRAWKAVCLDHASFGTGDSYEVELQFYPGLNKEVYVDDWSVVGPFASEPNGPYDLGGGDGLGDLVPSEFVNLYGFEYMRDDHWPIPSFDSNGDVTGGSAILLVESDPIDDLQDFLEAFVLRPHALYLRPDAEEKLTCGIYYPVPPVTVDVLDGWNKSDFKPSGWKRDFPNKVNKLTLKTDWNAANGDFGKETPADQDRSIEYFGESKANEIEARGHRTGIYSFPDYSGVAASSAETGARRILLDLSNPWSPLKLRLFYKWKDTPIGSALVLNIPGIPNLATGEVGVTERLYMMIRKQTDHAKGYVDVEVVERRPLSRPAFVAPNTVASSYSSASAADKEYCYIAGNDAKFDNGDEAYTVP